MNDRHIPWTDRLLIHLIFWCRRHLTAATAFYHDVAIHEGMIDLARDYNLRYPFERLTEETAE